MSGPAVARIALPPGWWSLPLAPGVDPGDELDGLLTALVPGDGRGTTGNATEAVLRQEWAAVVGAARIAGGRLVAGGTAVDPDTEQLVSATLVLSHRQAERVLRPEDLRPAAALATRAAAADGAVADVVEQAAGPASRAVRLDEVPLPTGAALALMHTDFVFPTTADGVWTLSFTTPALRHAVLLGAVFDAVAATLRWRAAARAG